MMPSAAGSRTRALHRTQARAEAPRWIRCARPEWLPPLFCLRLILLRSPWRPHSRLAHQLVIGFWTHDQCPPRNIADLQASQHLEDVAGTVGAEYHYFGPG